MELKGKNYSAVVQKVRELLLKKKALFKELRFRLEQEKIQKIKHEFTRNQ